MKIQYPNNLVAVNSFQYLNESIFRNFTQLYLGSFQDVTNKIEFFDGNIILSNTIFQAMYNNNEEKEEFSYDNKINPLAQMNIASIYNIIQQNSPVYGYGKFNTISKNNVIKIKITDTWNSGIRYEYLTHQYSNNNYLIHSVYQDMSSSTYKIDYYYY